MPCTVWFSVDGWDEGSQDIYIWVKDYDNEVTGNAQVQVCVPPPPPENCVYISWPQEWMRIPCTGTSGYNCVEITAELYDYAQCSGVTFTEARFEYSDDHGVTWYKIGQDVIGSGPWTTCWDNSDLVEDGDTIEQRATLRAEGGQRMWFRHWFGTDPDYAYVPQPPTVEVAPVSDVLTMVTAVVDPGGDHLDVDEVTFWWSSTGRS